MDVLHAELVDELKNASSNGGFPDGGYIGVGAEGGLVLQDDAIELRNVQLVRRRARRNVEGKTVAGENGASNFEDQGLDCALNRRK